MSGDPLDGMRERIVKCRRLAKQILDVKATQALLEMAEEIERDLKALEAEREARRTNPERIAKEAKPTIIIRPE
jgi:hypothetical protein